MSVRPKCCRGQPLTNMTFLDYVYIVRLCRPNHFRLKLDSLVLSSHFIPRQTILIKSQLGLLDHLAFTRMFGGGRSRPGETSKAFRAQRAGGVCG